MDTTAAPRHAEATDERPWLDEVQDWMVLRLALHMRRARTRRELFAMSERDLDRMGLTRIDIEG